MYDPKKNLVKGICEVKTTKNKSKREFRSKGICEIVMKQANKNGIPLFFSVVRLNGLLPPEIITDKGLTEVLEKLKKDDSFYKIEFYKGGEFELDNGVFKIIV